jgi:putative oxidoreductase
LVSLGILVAFVQRLALVLLFLPASALDKILNFRGAEKQAAEISPALAPVLIGIGLFVEIFMSLGILTGVADRLAAFIMGGYCGVTALLWKQFWKPGDFWSGGKGRDLFWDFLKNFALGAGFMFITFGVGPAAIGRFVAHPFASTHPYTAQPGVETIPQG